MMGFNRQGAATVYREWAPAAGRAALIGDFNNWEGTEMQRDEFGVWSVTLPDRERPALPVSAGHICKCGAQFGRGVCSDTDTDGVASAVQRVVEKLVHLETWYGWGWKAGIEGGWKCGGNGSSGLEE